MSSSTHIDNEKKDILVLGKGPTQGLEQTLTAEKCTQLILLWQKRNSDYNGSYKKKFILQWSK